MQNPLAVIAGWNVTQRRLFWRLLIASAIVFVYAIFGFFVVPAIARSQLIHFVERQYQRQVTVGQIRFNPFTLTFDIRNFSLPDRDRQTLLSFTRLQVNFEVSSIWHRGPAFASIALTDPYARVLIREDGALNLADLAPATNDAKANDSAPLRVFITHLQIADGRVAFEDRSRARPFVASLQPISFDLRDFSTTTDSDNVFRLLAKSAAGEQFSWAGTFEVAPLSSSGKFEVNNLQASTVRSYLNEAVNFDAPIGIIALNGSYQWTTGDKAGLGIKVEQLRITDLHLRPTSGSDDYVQLNELLIGDVRIDTVTRSLVVGSTRLNGGMLHAWLDKKSQLNLLELSQPASDQHEPTPPAAASQPATPQPAAPPWTMTVTEIALNAVHINAEDRHVTPNAVFAIDPLSLTINDFTTARGGHATLNLDAAVNTSGRIHANASVDLDSKALTGTVDVTALDLTALQPYIVQRTAMSLLNGKLGTKLVVASDPKRGLHITGDAEIVKLHTIDNELKEDFINWDRLRLEKIDYREQPSALRIGAVVAQAPYARVIIDSDRKVNISQVLRSNATQDAEVNDVATSAVKPSQQSASMAISIGTVRIENGSADYSDYWIKPNFATGIQAINGSIKGLSSEPNSRAVIELDGKVDRYSPLHIAGEVNPLAATAYGDIKMDFHNLDLTAVTPYSGHFAGYKIVKGQLSATLAYHIENRALQASHRFVIHELQLGDRVESADAVSLPLKLAVALLKDSNGVIDLELPVTGSLDDPQFRLGPIIWKVFTGLITKAATAPFHYLASLFGGGADMNLIDFKPGSAALDDTAQSRLSTVAKALRERPHLELDVPMSFSEEIDRPMLAKQKLERRLLTLKRNELASRRQSTSVDATVLADPLERFRLTLALYRQSKGLSVEVPPAAVITEAAINKKEPANAEAATLELETALLPAFAIDTAELESLGKARAGAIQDRLLTEKDLDAARIFVVAAHSSPPVGGLVRVELGLK